MVFGLDNLAHIGVPDVSIQSVVEGDVEECVQVRLVLLTDPDVRGPEGGLYSMMNIQLMIPPLLGNILRREDKVGFMSEVRWIDWRSRI